MVGSDKYWTVYSDFLLSVMGCKKRQPAQFEDLSTKSILEKILRMNKSQKSHRKLFSEDKKGLRRFRSSPNIYAEVTGNFSLKPTISIKRGHTDKLGGNYRFCDFASEKEYKSLSASLDYRNKCCWGIINLFVQVSQGHENSWKCNFCLQKCINPLHVMSLVWNEPWFI